MQRQLQRFVTIKTLCLEPAVQTLLTAPDGSTATTSPVDSRSSSPDGSPDTCGNLAGLAALVLELKTTE